MNESIRMMSCYLVFAMTAAALPSFSVAQEEVPLNKERVTFGKWHVGVGAAFNGSVKAHLGMRNLPVPGRFVIPGASTRAAAWQRANAHVYDGGGFISPDSLDNGFATENWELPVSDYQGNGAFDLGNAYREVVGSSLAAGDRDSEERKNQYGISIEMARELWIHDENDEHRWGVDFVAAFSYFFQRDIYGAHGALTRTDYIRDGVIRTPVNDPDAMWKYDQGLDSPVGGLYGHGNFDSVLDAPALRWDSIGQSVDQGGPIHPVVSSRGYSAFGDYQELEMLFMFRPWYEITDWWRVFAQAGVGVSWGRFDSTFHTEGRSFDEDFAQWDCYGVAGVGTVLRYKRVTLLFDALWRFWRDDLEVDGRFVRGSIDRAGWGLRLMLGYEF